MFGHPFSNVTDNAEDFLSTKNIAMLEKAINKGLQNIKGCRNGIINRDTVINNMRNTWNNTKLRNVSFMNKVVVNGTLQRIKDEQDFIEMNQNRNIWITNYLPNSGIVRMNGIKTN